MQHCPFCGGVETDRIEIEGRKFLVFACMFTPEVGPKLGEAELTAFLSTNFTPDRQTGYFRGMCDRLHLYVAKGEGARALTSAAAETRRNA
jgi:hypothetical protein